MTRVELTGAIKAVKVTKPGQAEVAFVVRLPGVYGLMATKVNVTRGQKRP